jgi:hypothetical protein
MTINSNNHHLLMITKSNNLHLIKITMNHRGANNKIRRGTNNKMKRKKVNMILQKPVKRKKIRKDRITMFQTYHL